jgi:peptidoglycan/xylan/chitin deacetylase (PgdA/CDA1 family)
MKFYCSIQEPEKKKEQILIALQFLKNTGFFFEMDPALSQTCPYMLQYGGEIDPEFKNRFQWMIYIPKVEFSAWDKIHVEPFGIQIPVHGKSIRFNDGIPIANKQFHISGKPVFTVNPGERILYVEIDLIQNIYFHLMREEEQSHEQFYHAHSVLSEYLHIPVVDVFVYMFKQAVVESLNQIKLPLAVKKRWPAGQPLWYVLSHDVDLTRKWGPKSLIVRGLPLLFQGKIHSFKRAMKEVLLFENSYWTFPELISYYDDQKWHATFFFLAEPWEGFSYRYNIRKKSFRDLFRILTDHGHEIGLHTSKFSYRNEQKVEQEKQILQQCINWQSRLPIGVRQHFLRCTFPDAYGFFKKRGFYYDSSMAYNEHYGFRSGTSLPYQISADENVSFWEFPFFAFEYHFTPEHFFEKIRSVIRILEKTEGIFHFLFHPSNLAESGYRKIFHYLNDFFIGRKWMARFTIRQLLQYLESWHRMRMEPHENGVRIFSDMEEPVQIELYHIQKEQIGSGKILSESKDSVLVEIVPGGEIKVSYEI